MSWCLVLIFLSIHNVSPKLVFDATEFCSKHKWNIIQILLSLAAKTMTTTCKFPNSRCDISQVFNKITTRWHCFYLGRLHISQLVMLGWLRKVQWAHVHKPPPPFPPMAPPMGGRGFAVGPMYDDCLDAVGDGAETGNIS